MKKKLFFTVFMLFATVMLIYTLITYNLASTPFKQQIMFSLEYTEEILQESGKRFDNSFRNANVLFSSNKRFSELCMTDLRDEVEYVANVTELYDIYSSAYKSFLLENNFFFGHVSLFIPDEYPIVAEKFVYNKTYNDAFVSEGIYSDKIIKDKQWYLKLSQHGQLPYYFKTENGYYCIAQNLTDKHTNKIMATALCVVNLEELHIYMSSRIVPGSVLYFVDKSGKCFYGKQPEAEIKLNTAGEYKNSEKYIISNVEWINDFYVLNVLESKNVLAKLHAMQKNIIVSSCILIFVSIFVLLFLSNHISRPITNLCRLLSKSEIPKPEDIPTNCENREMTFLYNSLRMYMERIQTLTEENIAREKSKKIYELAALEHQINPHFLYNVLNSISAKAMYGQYGGDISDVCCDVAYIMRYNSKDIYSAKPLRYELSCVDKYVEVYRNIYDADIEFDIDVSEEIQNISMPKYILQPLVENSIIHGGRETQYSIYIHIEATTENNILYITITDDGCGCDSEAINERLKTDAYKSSDMHTGIINVHKRLELRYGKGYGLKFCNVPKGTKVEILLPVE